MTDKMPTLPVDVEHIKRLLPHRYPFLLVDRVIDMELGKHITAIKNVTLNEPFFQGHFPHHPVMPGVLIVEAMAQAAGVLFQLSSPSQKENAAPMYYLVKVDNARFNSKVIPGDQLRMEVSLKRLLRGMGIFEAEAFVEERKVASCVLMCAAGDR